MSTKLPLPRAAAGLALAVALVAIAGCDGGPPRARVRGKVTLDGVPLKEGSIEFFPTGPTGQSAGTLINDGEYAVEASVGEMKVSINANEVVGKMKMYDTPDSPVVDKLRPLLPPRYNAQTELRATLTEGPNEVNFDLKGDGKKK